MADESEIQRIAEKGSKQVRRAEFDFIETSPQLVIAMLNKSSAAAGSPAGGGGARARGGPRVAVSASYGIQAEFKQDPGPIREIGRQKGWRAAFPFAILS